jgi:hypothetical protein
MIDPLAGFLDSEGLPADRFRSLVIYSIVSMIISFINKIDVMQAIEKIQIDYVCSSVLLVCLYGM